jgi:signal peptidase II
MISGTLGNFIDRIRLKYVVDMFQVDWFNFPIFNIADSCLTIGVLILMIAIMRDNRIEG